MTQNNKQKSYYILFIKIKMSSNIYMSNRQKGTAKKLFFSGPVTKGGGGLETKKKLLFLNFHKKFPKKCCH